MSPGYPLRLAAMPPGPRLGIDFGTSHTVSLVAWPDGRVRPLLFDGSPLLPSAVCAESHSAGGLPHLLVGRDAIHAARIDPARFEATPKRRIDDTTVLLGTEEFPVSTLIAAVLARVREEAVRVLGGQPAEVVLSHPAAWGVSRRLILLEAASQAGLSNPALVPEPVAAAQYFAGLMGERFALDQGVLVYDFGGGTFDASLVIRTQQGFDVRAVDGIDDLGGLDLDELVVEHTRQHLGDQHTEVWQRLSCPQTPEDRRHRRSLWDDARMVKERLSRAETATFHIPSAGTDASLSRVAFEALARPAIERTARTTAAVLRWSQLPKERLAGVFLVGGSSRIPLVATVLERELGIAPTALEQPELVVAEGALQQHAPAAQPYLSSGTSPSQQPTVPQPQYHAPQSLPQAPVQSYPHPQLPVQSQPHVQLRPATVYAATGIPPRRRLTLWLPFLIVLSVLAAVAVTYALLPAFDRGGSTQGGATRSASPSATQPPYQRLDRPTWVPSDWVVAASGPAEDLWLTKDEKEGGRCEAAGETLKVVRPDATDLTGCTIQDQHSVNQIFYDVAIETEVTVHSGCAAIWARTGTKGYSLAICDGYARLYRLGQTSTDTVRLGEWRYDYRPQHAVVGLIIVNDELTTYLSGVRLGDPIRDDQIRYGKVTAGGHPGSDTSFNVEFGGFRVFAPKAQPAQQPTTAPHTQSKPGSSVASSPPATAPSLSASPSVSLTAAP
ncbi:MAG: Hsp70 family protein [Micromonosporaceae bacterium]|nr:Hsp70 family protein [Micromonosporaceae bacterium]